MSESTKRSKWLSVAGGKYIPLVAGKRSFIGCPDVFYVGHGWRGLIEFKDEHTRVTPIQLRVIQDLNRMMPFTVLLVRFIGRDEFETNDERFSLSTQGIAQMFDRVKSSGNPGN